jgi:hypothetical protein
VIAENFVRKLTKDVIDNLLMEYSDDILPENRRKLISYYLYKKIDILEGLIREVVCENAAE